MSIDTRESSFKEESEKKILKNAISTKNKDSSSRKKQLKKKHLARFNKRAAVEQNICEEPEDCPK